MTTELKAREAPANYVVEPPRVKQGYKQTEVGVIPEDWDARSIENDIDLLTGFPFPSSGYSASGVRLLRGSNVKRGETDWADEITQYWPSVEPAIARYELRNGDLVIAMDGSLVGRSAATLASSDLPALLLQRVARVRSTKRLDVGYLAAFVMSDWFVKHSDSVKTVTAIPHISPADIGSFKIPIPPTLKEQRAIAAALSDVDALLAKLDQLIAKKRDLKQAAMQQLLTGQTRLPGFSGEWGERPIATFSSFVTKGSTPTTYGFNWENDGVLFLRSECVSADGLDLTQSMFISETAHAALIRGEVRAGDILMTITGNVGRVVRLTGDFGVANINQHIARIRVKDPGVSSDFVFHWLSKADVRSNYALITTGQAYPQISLKQVRETLVPLPSFPEQTAIAAILSDMDTELAALEARRDKTRALKQGMMQELLTGRIRLA